MQVILNCDQYIWEGFIHHKGASKCTLMSQRQRFPLYKHEFMNWNCSQSVTTLCLYTLEDGTHQSGICHDFQLGFVSIYHTFMLIYGHSVSSVIYNNVTCAESNKTLSLFCIRTRIVVICLSNMGCQGIIFFSFVFSFF